MRGSFRGMQTECLPALDSLANLLKHNMEQLPSYEETFESRMKFYQGVSMCLSRILNAARMELHVSGSVVTGLFLPSSDIDFVAVGGGCDTMSKKAKVDLLESMKRSLRHDFPNTRVIKATVPIVKWVNAAKPGHFNYDISIGADSLPNSYWVRQYVETYPFFRPLVIAIKAWSKSHGVYNPDRGGLGSYAIYLMALFFLVDGSVVEYFPPTATPSVGFPSIPPLLQLNLGAVDYHHVAHLLYSFFNFYASEIDVGSHVIGFPLPEGVSAESQEWKGCEVVIENPFIPGSNISKNVDQRIWKHCWGKFCEAREQCVSNPEELFRS
jgi:DNA polymerase sigma